MANKVRNYRFFDKFNWYLPSGSGYLALLGWFIVGIVIGNVAAAIFMAASGNGPGTMEYAQLIAYPLMFIPAMLYAGRVSQERSMNCEGIKYDSSRLGCRLWVCAAAAAVGTLATAYCVELITDHMPKMPEALEALLKSMTSGNLFINLLTVGIMAPFFEEWLCRGTILRSLLGRGMKPVWAIPVSALIFGIIHLNPWQAVPAFVLGCLFGYVYYKTGSLKLTMLMHFVNNTSAVLLSRVDALEDMNSWSDVLPANIYWIIYAACALLLILVVRYFSRIPAEPEKVKSLFSE